MKRKLPAVAYFCMEYGLDDRLKTYAGGLGILAGDYLKGARQYQYPVVGIGIKWKQGYTNQLFGENGRVYDAYVNYDYDFLEDTGVRVTLPIRRRKVVCKVWAVTCFNNAPLYLLDTDLPENEDPWITGRLYGGFIEKRIAQEMVLGIGGVKALRALKIPVEVYHFNEGHAVFAGLELIREKTEAGASFAEAVTASRREIVFTTHTPVIHGNEEHPLDVLLYMGANNGLSLEQLVKIGGAPFNMTAAALRLARKANAVSRLHGRTANNMWAHVDGRAEIISITNGIHLPTWVDEKMLEAAEGNGDLWARHMENKRALLREIEKRKGISLDPEVLLIGSARRMAPYKRNALLFSDHERAGAFLKNHRVQLVFSGKAHPWDDEGKRIIAGILKMSKMYPRQVVFLENYDMELGKMLTRGVDLWLNNPRRPREASGTSGMKAAMNGVPNCSILDGWWPEVCQHGVNGWQFGDGFESEEQEVQDQRDLQALYEVLEKEIIPLFYNNRAAWVEVMKNSILSTRKTFNIRRMLEEYYEKLYLPV